MRLSLFGGHSRIPLRSGVAAAAKPYASPRFICGMMQQPKPVWVRCQNGIVLVVVTPVGATLASADLASSNGHNL
jgi:hypothetical protein